MSSPGGDLPRRYREARRDPGLAVLEGFHTLKHAIRFGADVLEVLAVDPDGLARLTTEMAPDLTDRLTELASPIPQETFAELSPSPHPTGIVALARRPVLDPAAALATPGPGPVVFLDRPTHHGNIGAVVRVAAAAGSAAVLVTGPHDPWHPASLRGGAGLQFALPVAQVDGLAGTDRVVIALDPDGVPLGEAQVLRRAVLLFGSERRGLGAELLERAEQRVAIPMRQGVSSLNLATAVAVVLYHGRTGGATAPGAATA